MKTKIKSIKLNKKEQNDLIRLQESAEIYSIIYFRIECFICGIKYKTNLYDKAEEHIKKAARECYDDGWRYGLSKKYQSTGHMCKTCYKTPDAKR